MRDVHVRRHARRLHETSDPHVLGTYMSSREITGRDFEELRVLIGDVPGADYRLVGGVEMRGASMHDIDIAVRGNRSGFEARLRQIGLRPIYLDPDACAPYPCDEPDYWEWGRGRSVIPVDIHEWEDDE